MIKHGPGMDLEDLDFKAIDKEIEADEAAQAAQATAATGEDPPESEKDKNTMLPHLDLIVFFFLFSFFCWKCPVCFKAIGHLFHMWMSYLF